MDKVLDILKGAILLEKRGQAFYTSVIERSDNADVKTLFRTLVAEEAKHQEILEEQYKQVLAGYAFTSPAEEQPGLTAAEQVLSQKVKASIEAAGFEAAAISAAMALEAGAVEFYSAGAEKAQDSNEKALYRWLADWEKTHLYFLADIDKELKEKIWFDQHFWPII